MSPPVPFAGELMSLAAALCWAIAVFLFRRARDVDPLAINLVKHLIAVVLFGGAMLVLGQRLDANRAPEEWARLVGSGLVGITLGDTLFFAGLQRIGPSVAAITDCAYSPVVVLLSVLVLGEPAHPTLWIALGLVAAGLLLVAWQRQGMPAESRVDRAGVLLAIGGVVCTALGVILAKPALAHASVVEATAVRLTSGGAALRDLRSGADPRGERG